MDSKQKIKYLSDKGFSLGDLVTFRVENQCSGGYLGPNKGFLIMPSSGEDPYILCNGWTGDSFVMSIDKGYDAYIGSIKHWKPKSDSKE